MNKHKNNSEQKLLKEAIDTMKKCVRYCELLTSGNVSHVGPCIRNNLKNCIRDIKDELEITSKEKTVCR